MKGILVLVLLSVFVVGLTLVIPGRSALAQEEPMKVRVLLDDYPVSFAVSPILVQGRSLVPFRTLAEALGTQVGWDGVTQMATATDGKNQVQIKIGSTTAYRNGLSYTLDVPAQLSENRTLVPLRFFSEALGCKVDWDGATYTVRIISPPKPMEVLGYYALGDSQTSSWTDLFGRPFPETTVGNTDLVREIALGWYSLDSQGKLLTASVTGWRRPEGWERVMEAAGRYGLATQMVVHMTDGRGELSALLKDEAARQRAASEIAAEAVRYSGVNLDLEGLGFHEAGGTLAETRERFSGFVELISRKLKATETGLPGQPATVSGRAVTGTNNPGIVPEDLKKGKTLSLTLHAPNSVYLGYDYAALGKWADRIIVMAYDYGEKPEPNAQVLTALAMAKKEVPAEKLLLGISAASETPPSLAIKIGLAKRLGLKGIALWRLGLISPEMWREMRGAIEVRKP
ncbi:MAG: stalk domain-containing protein [Firmicutes bacterium]|nr:stalk domain-containing protein [Bacillota bacterium]MCL5039865.1 stalk domain-containing protein [Bacillota bacterium]